MSASKYCKSQGLPSLTYVANKVGERGDKLTRWFKTKPTLFKAVVFWAASEHNKDKQANSGVEL